LDAKLYIEEYAAKEHAGDPTWLSENIQKKISSVGGLLSEEAAIMLIAGEHGWAMEETPIAPQQEKQHAPITSHTELTDYCLDLIWDTTEKGDEYRKFPREPLVVKVVQVYDAHKPKYGFAKMQTGVKVTDGKNVKYFNFEDKEQFTTGDRTFPANLMSSAVQQVRQDLLGKTIAVYGWELFKGQKGFNMTSTAYTYFKVVDTSNFEEEFDYLSEVPIEEVTDELA